MTSIRHAALAPASLMVAGLMIAQAAVLVAMGHPLICTCGTVKLFLLEVHSRENSQHIADWYTPSHLIHGFLFYLLAWAIARKSSLGFRLGLAVVLEVGWEIVENTPFVINRYRDAPASLDYFGDSVINSLADTATMILGFVLAWRMPVWSVIAVAVVLEVAVGLHIRDNLTLNVIMLLFPSQTIGNWQTGPPIL